MSVTPPSTISVQPLVAESTGVATGINWSNIIQELLSVQQQPITALQNQESLLQQKDTVYTNIQTSLSSVQTAADALRQLGGNALNGTVATSSEPTVASATAQPGALVGTVSVNVLSLASPATATSTAALNNSSTGQATAPSFVSSASILSNSSFDPTASLASQAADLNNPVSSGGSFSVNGTAITWTSAESLQSLLGSINSANVGVVASFNASTGKVSLTGTNTGSGSTVDLSESSGGLLASLGLSAGSSTGTDATTFDPTQPLATQAAYMATPVTAGTVTLNGVVFTIDPATQSLNDIMRAFYGSSAGVQGLYDSTDGTLSLATKTTGSAAQIKLGASGDTSNLFAALNLGPVTQGQNAQVQVNGGTAQSLASNTSTSLLPGASVTLQGVGNATINVSPDGATAASDISALVSAYNSAVTTVSTQLNQTPPAATTGSTPATPTIQGAFIGDALLQRTQDQLTNVVVDTSLTGGQISQLSQIGLTLTDSAPGQPQTLSFNQSTFLAAFQSDPTDVQALVGGSGTGLADNLYQAMNALTDPTVGAYALQLNGDSSTESDMATQITTMQAQLTQQQQAMTTQYATLEASLGAMQAQASQLSGTFTTLSAAI
jgi:flagellar hook-associated protein 2